MLILAGVSLNAIIGDNGIITNAQNANILSSCAVLSEYFNEIYVGQELDDMIGYDSEVLSPLDKLAKNNSQWFYHRGSNNFIITDYQKEDGTVELLKTRLIRKNQLPIELRNQIIGGDATDEEGISDSSKAYDQLIDVYGVTGDLQVFYCKNGLTSSVGGNYASSLEYDKFDGTKTVYSSTSTVAQLISQSTGKDALDLNTQDLRKVYNLTIDKNSGVSSLEFLYDMPNISKIELKSYQGSLSGLEKAYKLKILYIDNTAGDQNITDFSGLSGCTNLEEFICMNISDDEEVSIFNAMKDTAYGKLKKLGFVGYYYYLRKDGLYDDADISLWSNLRGPVIHTDLSSVSNLKDLNATTKNSIERLYLNSNSLTKSPDLSSFSNLKSVFLGCNWLSSLDKFPKSLYELDLNTNLLVTDGIKSLENLSLERLGLSNNYIEVEIEGKKETVSGITDISFIKTQKKEDGSNSLKQFYDQDYPIMDETLDNSELNTYLCGIPTLLLSTKYALLLSNRSSLTIPADTTDGELSVLHGNTYINNITLDGCSKLTDDAIQGLLANLPNLSSISAVSTNMRSLNFLTNMSALTKQKIKSLNIRGCYSSIDEEGVKTPLSLQPLEDNNIKLTAFYTDSVYDLSDYETSMTYLINNGSICATKWETLKTIAKLDITRWRGDSSVTSSYVDPVIYDNSGSIIPYVLDLTSCRHLTTVSMKEYRNVIFKFPDSVTTADRCAWGVCPDFSNCSKINSINITGDWQGVVKPVMPTDNHKIRDVKVQYAVDYQTWVIPNNAGTLTLGYTNPWGYFINVCTNPNFEGTVKADSLILKSMKGNTVNTLLANAEITELTLYNCDFEELPTLKDNSAITYLNLDKNKISDLESLSTFTNLRTLILTNNALGEYYTDSSGNSRLTEDYIKQCCPTITTLQLDNFD